MSTAQNTRDVHASTIQAALGGSAVFPRCQWSSRNHLETQTWVESWQGCICALIVECRRYANDWCLYILVRVKQDIYKIKGIGCCIIKNFIIFTLYQILFFLHGSTVRSGPGSRHWQGFTITLRHTTLCRNHLDKWSVRRRDLCLTIHNSCYSVTNKYT